MDGRPPVRVARMALHRTSPRRALRRRGRASRPSPARSTSAPAPAASSRPPTAVRTGRTSPTASSTPPRSAPSPCPTRIRTSSTRAPARRAFAATSRTATACTAPTTAATAGATSASPPTRHISRVVIHPTNPDVVYVAALGHAWGPNPERGIYRSTDGGASWDLVLHKSDRAGAADLTMDMPQSARAVRGDLAGHAATRTPPRAAARIRASGAASTAATPGPSSPAIRACPRSCSGRIGVTASPAQPGRVWALVEAEDGAMFRSDDYGETWERLSRGRRPAPPPVVLHARLRRSAEPEHRVGAEPELLAVGRRRQDLRTHSYAARRQPRPVDRSAQLATG